MNNPAYFGSGIAPPTNAPAHTRSILTRRVSASALLSVVLLVAGHPQVSAVTYTVCPSGCDYATIQAAVNAVPSQLTQPVIIQVSEGTYRERVQVINKKGTAPNPLVIKVQGTVTIDGSDDLTGHWTQYSTQVWSTGVSFQAPLNFPWRPGLS